MKRLFNIPSLSVLLMFISFYWYTWFQSTSGMRIFVFGFLAILLAFWLIFVERYTISKRMLIIALGVILFSALMRTPLFLPALIAGFINQKTPRRQLFSSILCWSALLWLLTVVSSQIGLLENLDIPKWSTAGELIHRYGLGFANPNAAALFLLPPIISAYYLYGRHHATIFSLLSILATVPTYIITESDTILYIVSALIITNLLQNRTKWANNFIKFLRPQHLIIALTALSIGAGLMFGANTPNDVNTFFSSRPYFINLRVADGSIFNLSGNADNWTETYESNENLMVYPLDNMYIRALVYGGMIAYILLLIGSSELGKISDTREKTIVLLALVYGLAENPLIFIALFTIMLSSAEKRLQKKVQI